MPEKLTCKFQMTKTDDLGRKKFQDCGEPAGAYELTGKLSSLKMPLCDRHKFHVIEQYDWIVTKINDKELRDG